MPVAQESRRQVAKYEQHFKQNVEGRTWSKCPLPDPAGKCNECPQKTRYWQGYRISVAQGFFRN